MPKKEKKQYNETKKQEPQESGEKPTTSAEAEAISKLPADIQEKLKLIREKLEKFQKKVIDKFDKYISGIALLPPPRPETQQPVIANEGVSSQIPLQNPDLGQSLQTLPPVIENKDQIHVLVLVDDSDSKTMSKQELKDKLTAIIIQIGKEVDPNIVPQTLILSELWQNVYDGKHELLQMIAMSAPIFDVGMLQAIKIAEVHKTMVLKKFEKYIVSYVLAGSLVQGKATPTS